MDNLRKALEVLFNSETIPLSKDDESGLMFFGDSPERDEAEDLACACLITSNGGCNWGNIMAIEKDGYDVYAGDQDSFGWLTGCIEKNGKVLVYG